MRIYKYINNQSQLDEMVIEISKADTLGVDLEFDKNRFAYGFTISLIQLNYKGKIYVVDAMEDLDLTGVFNVFCDQEVLKVVFAFGEDIRLLHSLGCFAKNIFDLDFAAKLLGYDQFSLSKITTELLGKEDSSSSQKSNWLKRPLTEKQLLYAANDVLDLFELKKILLKKIKAQGTEEWLKGENSKYEENDYSQEVSFSPIKHKDKKNLSEYEFYLLEQLMSYREGIAERLNKPGYQIASKEVLFKLIKNELNLGDLHKEKVVSKHFKTSEVKSYIYELFKSTKENASELNVSADLPAIKRLSPEDYAKMRDKKKRQDELINQVFIPIKKIISESYSQETANFILSNKVQIRTIEDGLSSLPSYKQKLIEQISSENDLPLHLLTES